MRNRRKGQASLIGFFIVMAVSLITVWSSSFVVPAGSRGVVFSQSSGIVPLSYGEGFHWKAPFVTTEHDIEVRTQLYSAEAAAASNDLQDVHTTIGVNFRIDPDAAYLLYQGVGEDFQDKVIAPAVQDIVKATTAKYTAEELVHKREIVRADMQTALHERLGNYHILVDTVSMTNFAFSASFDAAINEKTTAEQQAKAEENKVAIETAIANQKRAKAQGDADATRINAQAEADSLRIRAEALKNSPQLVQLEMIKKWNGALPTIQGSQGMILQMPFPTQEAKAA